MMTVIPENPQRSVLSFPAVLWFGAWGTLAFGCAFGQRFGWFLVFLTIAVAGWLPLSREGPNFLVFYRKLRFQWKRWRLGTAYRREISSTQMVLQHGVSPLKGLFKVQIVLLEFKSATEKVLLQIPALMNGRRHTIMVEAGTNPEAAMADPEDRAVLRELEASVYVDLAEELGPGNSFTIWSLHRRPDRSADMEYLQERLHPDIRDERTPRAARTLREHHRSIEEIVEDDWDRRRGLALTATNPALWKPRKLNSLTADELQESRAVRAALMVEDKMSAAGVADVSVSSYPSFCRLLREVFNVTDQDLPRDRALQDIITESLANADGEMADPRALFVHDETPLPVMQREIGNNYLIFDGTYHRVLWVTNYMSQGSYDALHSAKCDYFVSIYADIWDARKDDSRRQDKGRVLKELQHMFKHNITAQDEEELQRLEDERYDALRYGRYVVYFRTLIIVSGDSLKKLEENHKILVSHLARSNIRVNLKTVVGAGQLEWFFAALGSFGVSK